MHVLILRLCGKAVKLVFGVFKAEQKMCDTIVMLVMFIIQPVKGGGGSFFSVKDSI